MDNSLGGTSSASAIKTTASSPSDYIAKETVKPLLWIVHKMAFRHVPYLLDSMQLSSSILKRNKGKLTPPGCKEPFGWTPTVLLCAPPAAQPPQPCLPPSAALCRPSAAATPTGPHPSRRGTPPCRVVRGGLLSPAPQHRWPQRAAAARSNDGPGTSHRRRIS